jgi:hypothetical protein
VRPAHAARVRERSDDIRFEVVGKPGGGSRTLTRLGDRDQHRYRVAVARVVPAAERALGPGVIAHRARATATGFELERWPAARRRFLRSVASASAGPARAAFVGDVADCYGSILPAAVDAALRRVGAPEDAVRAIDELLRRFAAHGVRGLPVGPEPSAILANVVLGPVDRALTEATGGPSFRWVDDVVTLAADVAAARRAAAAFARSLDRLGLAAHPGKCRVVDDAAAIRTSVSRPCGTGEPGVA